MDYEEYWDRNDIEGKLEYPSPPTTQQIEKGVRWVYDLYEFGPWNGFWSTLPPEELNDQYTHSSQKVCSEEKIFYRSGDLPLHWNSYNYLEESPEWGVSCYFEKRATSFAGLADRPWFFGSGVQVGTGSDGEPLIIPTGPWKKCEVQV